MFKSIFLFFSSITFIIQVASAELGNFQSEYSRPISVIDGLASNEVNCILQDSKGYMWYGTNNGLSRYDGYVFKSYKSNYLNPYFFSNNKIISIAEDKSNCLWIGTALGLNQIDLSTGKLSHFENKLIMGITISSIVIASDNTPYFGTSNGLFYFDRKLNDFVQILKDTKGRRFLSTYITRLFIDDQNYLWIGAWETGCDVYNLNTKLFSEYSYLKKKELLIINNFFEDSNHNLWMSTWDKSGVYRIENPHQPSQSKITIFYPQKNEESTRQPVVYAINQNNTNGNILFATSNGLQTLLNIFKYENRVQLTNANSTKISNNEIYTIYKDRTGLIWYSNYGFGINAISSNRDNFEQYNLATLLGNTNLSSSITSVYESENGLLWLGVKSMVLSLFDRKSKTLTSYKDHPVLKDISNKANSILSFFKPSTLNELWLGTRYEGLYAVKLVQGKISTLEKKAITGVDPKNHGIKYMVEDQQNNIWLATTKGLIKAHQNKTGNYVFQLENGYKNRFLNQIINTLLIDNEQNLWVGTENIGLYKLTFSKNKIFIEEYSINNHKINNNEVICMLQDYKNRIWIGTKGGGLSLYNPENKKFEIVKNMSLIPDDAIYSIAEDNWGNIWLATGNGLVSYNEDLPIDQKIRFFSGKEGVKINSYNPNSVYKNNNNELFFGGNNGFMAFVPEKNVEKSFSPRPVITGFYVANEPLEDLEPTVKNKISKYDVSYADQLILDYNQKNIIIEFSALLYQNISATKYAYKLEGLDKDWVYVDSKKRFVNYNNLSKGNYRFHIKACNSLGAWCDQPTILYIKIKPAPWDTFFAYILYLFILFSIGFVVIRFIFNRMKLRKMFAIEQIEREKSEEVHQAKLKFFTNISHEFFTPITILSVALDGLRKRHPNELSTIYTMKANMDRLVRLLEQIVEFRKVETGNLKLKISEIEIVGFIKDLCDVSFMPLTTDKNISLHFETIPNEIVGYVDVDKLDKIIFNLLSNAFKYNKENGSVNVLIDTVIIDNQRHLLLKVSDNGYGMSETVKNNLFKRFYEGNFRDFKVKSIGIGLSLTHDLIEFHNGIISVESTEGIGSIFTISLPIDKECYDDSQIYLHTISNDEQNLQEDLQENSLVQTDAKFEKISVLIVEDNHELIQVMSEHLKAEFILSKAFNGEEALQILNHHKIDIVVTDILMPIMDGIELVNRMKSIVEYSHIPVLMISAKHNVEDKVEGFDAGADAYVIKPFEMPALIANIKSLVRNRRTLAQSFLLDPQQTNISKYAHNNTDKEFLEKVIKIIEDNVLEKNFITNDLYDALNISQSTLYRKLQVLIGISPNELIRKIRLKVASQLLLEDKLNISEIAYDLGFSDPKYFSIIFKKEIGVSPTEYKKTKRME